MIFTFDARNHPAMCWNGHADLLKIESIINNGVWKFAYVRSIYDGIVTIYVH